MYKSIEYRIYTYRINTLDKCQVIKAYHNSCLYSDHILFVPQGKQ